MTTPPRSYDASRHLFERAQHTIPGGVNSPVRAFKGVGGTPLFIRRAEGAYLEDADGHSYVDYVGSWGPMLLGHAFPPVVKAVQDAVLNSTSFGAPTEVEIEVAELISELVPSIEKVRMVNSGTEATMSAARLARGFTGRNKIIKFQGCYHGHADFFLIAAGSGALTTGVPNSPGVTPGNAADTLIARYNDLASVEALVLANSGEVACIIVEPVAGNVGCIPPEPGFLEGLRAVCDREGILLIFDEVMTGFRVARGGAQERYGVRPDLTTLGKIIGAGLPVGAYGGRRDVMDFISPVGPVYQAGTLSGNPLAMNAGLAMLRAIAGAPDLYERLEAYGAALEEGTRDNLRRFGLEYYQTRVGSMGCLFFTGTRVTDYDTALTSDTRQFGRYFHALLSQGVYMAPSQYEAFFFSTAHGPQELEHTLNAQRWAFEHILED